MASADTGKPRPEGTRTRSEQQPAKQESPYDGERLHEYVEDFRRAAHQAVDWIAEYLEHGRRYPVLPRIKPGDLMDSLPPSAPEKGEPFDGDPARFREADPPRGHALEPSALHGVLRLHRFHPGHPRRDARRRAEHQRHPLADLARGGRTGAGDAGLAAAVAGLAGRSSSASFTTRLRSAACTRSPRRANWPIRRRAKTAAAPTWCCTPPSSRIRRSRRARSRSASGSGTCARCRSTRNSACGRMRCATGHRRDKAAGKRPFCVVATVGTTSTTSVDPVGRHRRHCREVQAVVAR